MTYTQQWITRRIERAQTLKQLQQVRDDMGDEYAADRLIKTELMRREKELMK